MTDHFKDEILKQNKRNHIVSYVTFGTMGAAAVSAFPSEIIPVVTCGMIFCAGFSHLFEYATEKEFENRRVLDEKFQMNPLLKEITIEKNDGKMAHFYVNRVRSDEMQAGSEMGGRINISTTLLEKLDDQETLAVLYHEQAHAKMKHTWHTSSLDNLSLIVSACHFIVAGFYGYSHDLQLAFSHASLSLLAQTVPLLLSQRNELLADSYAVCETRNLKANISMMHVIHQKDEKSWHRMFRNLGENIFSLGICSHPTKKQRIKNIKATAKKCGLD